MYLAFVLLLALYCVAHLYFCIPMHLKSLQALTVKLFLVCFGLPSTNKKFFTCSPASLAMTKTLWSQKILQICRVFVIARPLYKNTINLSSVRPKQSVIIKQNTN